jgi:proline iminopeptidase
MKTLLRSILVASLLLTSAGGVGAQDGATRAEFECLKLANSSAVAVPGVPDRFPAFHHVWSTSMSYGNFNSNGLKLVYETQGEGSETIIVVHGGVGMPHDYYHPMLTNLSRYAKIVFFDRRADMLSTGNGHATASIDEQAEDIDALRKELGLNKVTVLGHSFGSTIAMNYALKHPENVKRLILVSASAVVEDPRESEKRLVATLSPSDLAVYRSGEGGEGGLDPCQRVRKRYGVLYPRYFYKMVPYEFDRGVYTVYFDSLAKKLALSTRSRGLDLRSRLGELETPVLIFAGKHDLVTPVNQAKLLADGLPNARLVVMNQSAHFPIFEENYLFTTWVRMFMIRTNRAVDDRMLPAVGVAAAAGK